MKVVMYHYVRKFSDKYPNFRFLDVSNFRKQLLFFEKEYGFVERDEWLEYVSTGHMPTKKGKVLLTFDDAMSCHYKYVFPELLDKGLWGVFYVPTNPYKLGKILDVHRIHLLCGAFEGDNLLKIALGLLTDSMIPDKRVDAFKNDTYKSQENNRGVSEFKRLMNYFIDYDHREKIIDEIAKELGYRFVADQFYVSIKNLLKMKKNGMFIGSHTASHPVMSKLSYKEQLSELKESFAELSEVFDPNLKTYCHPYGGKHDFNNNTIRALGNCGVAYSFMVDPRDVNAMDFTLSRHMLPRYDCNFFKFGRAS